MHALNVTKLGFPVVRDTGQRAWWITPAEICPVNLIEEGLFKPIYPTCDMIWPFDVNRMIFEMH